jgi:hypothetical protein
LPACREPIAKAISGSRRDIRRNVQSGRQCPRELCDGYFGTSGSTLYGVYPTSPTIALVQRRRGNMKVHRRWDRTVPRLRKPPG